VLKIFMSAWATHSE